MDAACEAVSTASAKKVTVFALAQVYQPSGCWADKLLEGSRRKEYIDVDPDTKKFISACYSDGAADESLRWTAEMVHRELATSPRVFFKDKNVLKLGTVKTLLKPEIVKSKRIVGYR